MNKKILFATTALMLSISTLSAEGIKSEKSLVNDEQKIEKAVQIYRTKLKEVCGFTGDKFAAAHTRRGWQEIKMNNSFVAEIHKLCPASENVELKTEWVRSLYIFALKYAEDSQTIPKC